MGSTRIRLETVVWLGMRWRIFWASIPPQIPGLNSSAKSPNLVSGNYMLGGFQDLWRLFGSPCNDGWTDLSFILGPPYPREPHFMKQGMTLAPWPRLRTKTVEEDAALAAKAGVDNSLKALF